MKKIASGLGKISMKCNIRPTCYNDLKTMKVKSLLIENIGGIPYLKLNNLNPQMNIICGSNGVGKTNILDSIAYIFSTSDNNVINKRAGSEIGEIVLDVDLLNEPVSVLVQEFDPSKYTRNRYHLNHNLDTAAILYLKVNRVFDYFYQDYIGQADFSDIRKTTHTKGVDNKDLKEWFVHRVLLSNTQGALEGSELSNINLAIESFSILDENVRFKTVTKFNEIIVSTPTGEIYFEYLSSGFKSTLFIILGIIKELDYRFSDSHMNYLEFEGIILIDEVELHLHPEWQGKISKILKTIFPKAQFFITTHSPHIIQSAGHNEVIALERKDDEVIKRTLPKSKYGYQGWTVEEVLKDVMGMKDLRTELYDSIRNDFIEAFRKQRKEDAKRAFTKLSNMLHPASELKAIYQMQLDSLGE
ncbi:AAA family ATPase [Acinetobacter vivianii]|uniref:AAA family ATPase n=1 Tax=Acinetobacter vivianii TaxID=1776742 RepID=UPI002DB7B507|nr:AAA family ATPase [Acinetobacter vivianii]MEB6666345.1 AAA family ATPase [Acinetobacter vivianii]